MYVDVIDSTKALTNLRADWDAVYDADPEAQFFLSATWMFKWLATIQNPLTVLAARPDGESAYVAFFPLWLKTKERKSGGFYNDINIGGNYIADYTGFLCRPEFLEKAVVAFARRIKQLNWTHFRLEYLCASEQRTALFLRAFSEKEFDIEKPGRFDENKVDLSICPVAHLPGDWNRYLDSLSANTRQRIRRVLRQTESSGEFRITHIEKDTVERDLEILLRFWTARWGPLKGKRVNGIQQNNKMMLRHCFAAGTLFLPVLWHGERPVCALAILVDERKKSFLFYMAGRDPTYDGPPPGLVLHAHSIQHAIRNGITSYHFLRGNEPYKYSFGVEERRVLTLVLSTKDRENLGGKLDRRSLRFALMRSMEHHRAGRRDEAERGYRQVLDLDPGSADALYGLGQIMAKRGEHAAAIRLLKSLVAARPDIAKGWMRLGKSLLASGNLSAAAEAYCECIERRPQDADAYYDLGHVLLGLGQFDQAVAAFDAVRSLKADYPDIDSDLMKAIHSKSGSSSKKSARRSSLTAELSDRICRLGAIAAASKPQRQAADSTPAVAREQNTMVPALQLPANTETLGQAAPSMTGAQGNNLLGTYHKAIADALQRERGASGASA